MAVPVEADLMALLGDLLALVRKRFERVTGDEERCLDIVLVEELQHTLDTDCPCEEATGYVRRRVLAAVRA